MRERNIFTENDFDPSEEILGLLTEMEGNGLPLDFAPGEFDGRLSVRCGEWAFANMGGRITINGECAELTDFMFEASEQKEFDFGRRHTAKYTHQKSGLSWIWTVFVRKSDVLVMASVKNDGNGKITISGWDLLCCDLQNGGNIFGPHSGKTTFLKWSSWDMGVRLIENGAYYESGNLLHLHDPGPSVTALVGFLTMSRMRTAHALETAENGDICRYSARLVFGEYELSPNQVFNSELCSISFHDDPYAALELWAEKVKNIYNPDQNEKRLPPVGWIGCFGRPAASGGEPWERHAIKNAKAIRERLRGFDIEYIWTSQNNLMDYIPGNWLHENKDEIPGGLANFFRMQKELGFKPGLWVSPFWFYGEAKNMLEEHCGHLLRDKEGNPVCREEPWGWKYEDDDLPWYHMHRYNFDGSHPDTIEFVRKLFSYYREIGVRYYMLDFLDIAENSVLYDKTKTAYQAGYALLREIRAASGNDTHMQTAVASSPGFAGIIDAARIGRDFGESRPLDTYLADWRNATNVLHDQNYANIKAFLQNVTGSYFTHRTLYMNDFNVFTADKPYPVEHARIVATTFGLGGGSPLMIGDNIADIGDERLRYIKLCLPRTPHSAKPADLFERVQPHDYSRILKLEINKKWESYMLVGAYNMDNGAQAYELNLDFGKLGLDADKKYVVYDFWNEEYCGVFKGGFPCALQPESCKLYRMAQQRPYPWLLSTDMHIQQGFCEVLDVNWDPENKRLSLSVTRPAGEKGNVYILMPKNYELIDAKGVHLLKELLDFNVVMQVPVVFKSEIENFSFCFKEWNSVTLSPRGHIPYSTKQEWLEYMRDNYKKQTTRVFE